MKSANIVAGNGVFTHAAMNKCNIKLCCFCSLHAKIYNPIRAGGNGENI